MCDPVTIATTAVVVGGGMQAYSQYQKGQYAKDMAEYNANVSNMQAEDAKMRGYVEEDRQRTRARQIMGAQRAAMGASGAEVDQGTFGDILTQTAGMGERDAITIRQNAMRTAWGYNAQAEADRFQGDAAAQAGTMNAAGTILTTAGSAYGMYNKWWKPTGADGGFGVKPTGGGFGLK